MPETLYIGNLPWSVTDDELAEFFAQHVRVIGARVMTDRETGRSRGFGFVDVEEGEAEAAIRRFNGAVLKGRALRVDRAQGRRGPRP
jgi:RNA recognition motif-containing protein